MKNKKIKKGMTLIDMIIAIGIFSMGMIGFTILFVRVWKSNSFIMEEGQATMMASRTIQQLVESLRKIKQADNGEFAIKSGNDFNFTVYLDDDNDGITERVHYFLVGESFKKGVTKPNAGTPPTYPSGDQVITIMANYVTNTAAQPIFYYYNKDYPGDIVNNPLNISPTLPIDKVKLVRIKLWINIKPLTAPDNVNFESFVDLRNLNENL
jgi:type II secretory pathway pseudopilin PulG